jgi:nitroreductase
MVEHAVLAPSSHNTQPWRFRIAGDRFELYADRTRSLPVNDPHDRELIISCGAALLNARLAAAYARVGLDLELLPEGDDAALLARATVRGGAPPNDSLFAAIAVRRTCRERFADRDVPSAIVAELRAAAASEGARLTIHEDERRRRLVAMVAAGDRELFADPRWRRELAEWMHPRSRGEGLAYPPLSAPVMRFVVRRFDVGPRTSVHDVRLAEAAPAVAVVATAGDSVRDWLRAGQALQRLLLAAAAAGLQASYLNQPIQVGRLRQRRPADRAPPRLPALETAGGAAAADRGRGQRRLNGG